jgi:hypothetical protein
MRQYKKIILLLVLICLVSLTTACVGGNKTERIRKKIKNYLYEKYGEEFVVDRIGTQTIDGRTNYVARIYPKSKVGKNGERDSYYSSKVGLEKKAFGRLGKVGSGYDMVKMKMQAEEYLMPKAKEIFGKRILLKPEVKYKRSTKEVEHYSWKIVSGFKKMLGKVKSNPEKHRIELELYVYVFDRLEDKAEKEERQKDIFEFVQYLKEESLFECLEMGVIFIDERVLADSYDKYDRKVYYSDKEKKVVQGERVELPPMKLRKEMSKELQQEVNEMNDKELLANMKKIKKEELSYRGIREYNGQYQSWVYSIGMLKEKYKSSITEEDRNRKYNELTDVKLNKYKKYLFFD